MGLLMIFIARPDKGMIDAGINNAAVINAEFLARRVHTDGIGNGNDGVVFSVKG